MRTTVDIPEARYRELKSKAVRDKRSAKKFILRGVEVELRSSGTKKVTTRKITVGPLEAPGKAGGPQ